MNSKLLNPGEVPVAAKFEPSKEALSASLISIRERQAEIKFLLGEGQDERRAAELQREHALLGDEARDITRQLNPPSAADSEAAKLHAANIAAQAEEARQIDAPIDPAVVEERKQNAAKRRAAILEAQYQEESSVLRRQIEKLESQSEFSQASILRQQLLRLKEDIERRFS